MLRKLIKCVKLLGRRRKCVVPLLVWTVLSLATFFWLGEVAGRALQLPPPPDQSLHHFKRRGDLQYYLDNINILIEPSSVSCNDSSEPLVLVSSAPSHGAHRRAIRDTWGRHLATYFVLGLDGDDYNEALIESYVEAKQFSDMIVYDLRDHYQNLTLKSVLMLQWTVENCPETNFLFKTDDDVLLNPWTLKTVLEEHPDAPLLGYMKNGTVLHRDAYSKWFVPRRLRRPDRLPRYLSGTGYLIKGAHLKSILEAAKKVPLMNLEDVYLTYLVSNSKLNLDLVHDRRLSPYRPWVGLDCAYWTLASLHSFEPEEITNAWKKIERVSKQYEKSGHACGFYIKYLESEYLLY